MSSSSSDPSDSDNDDYELPEHEYELPEDLRSIPVLWTLVVSRRSSTGRKNKLLKDAFSAQATAFNLEAITQERTLQPQVENEQFPVASGQNVIDVTTNVYDPGRRVPDSQVGRNGSSDRQRRPDESPDRHTRRDGSPGTPVRRGERRIVLPFDRLSQELRGCLALSQSVTLRSPLLRKALKSMVEYYPKYPPSSFDDILTIEEPFAVLIHHFPEIDQYVVSDSEEILNHCEEAAHKSVRTHLATLRDFLKPKYEDIRSSTKSAVQANAINFDLLWYVLRPGIDVYIETDGVPHVCVIESVSGKMQNSAKPLKKVKRWSVDMWCLDTGDGLIMSRRHRRINVKSFDGMRDLISLPVCPVSVWDALDAGARRAQVLCRNDLYLEGLQKNQNGHMHCLYDGPDIEDGGKYHGKVVIDHQNSEDHETPPFLSPDQYTKFAKYDKIYLRDQPANEPNTERKTNTDVTDAHGTESAQSPALPASSSNILQPGSLNTQSGDEPRAKKRLGLTEMTEHQRLLIWPQAPAFALSTKKWMTISLGHVSRVERSCESINNLQLDASAAQIIKALSMQQDQSGDSWGADFIKGKGAGQIILLHGPPGVGKTYTVEGISEWLRRPLLSLTVADIGTTETRVEQELMKWFDLAEAWNAVLLVDEADIFLEQRKNRDLSRNGLVSAFLRRMEYFRGLLFLTTNRVGQIDDAFVSRVHMAIGYETLSPEFRREIWKGFFEKLGRERRGKILVGLGAQKFVLTSEWVEKIELNGREIRNALQTAITLAEYESIEAARASGESGMKPAPSQLVVVEEDHFRRVLTMSKNFHEYVTSIRWQDEGERARAQGNRHDKANLGAANDGVK